MGWLMAKKERRMLEGGRRRVVHITFGPNDRAGFLIWRSEPGEDLSERLFRYKYNKQWVRETWNEYIGGDYPKE